MKIASDKNHQTQIKTSLPYCLYKIDNRPFKLGDGYNSTIKFHKVETIPNRRTQFSKNIEVVRDRWGIDAHSDVEISTDRTFANNDEAELFVLGMINDFIKRYRYHHKDAVHLVQLTKEDLFGLSIIAPDGRGVMSFSFAGGMTVVMPQRNSEVSDKIEQSIINKEEIPLWEELLLNAEQYSYQSDYRHSILESVIALELVISEFIRRKCKDKDISSKATDDYIKNVGLPGNIKVTIRLLSGNNPLPEDKVFSKCKASITKRNKIVHEGLKNVFEPDANDSLKYSRIMIDFLNLGQ